MRIFMVTLLLCVCGLSCVYAGEAQQIYLIDGEETDGYHWICNTIEFEGFFTHEEKAFIVFSCLFNMSPYCVPDGVRVRGVKIENDCLTVNVSEEILLYGGCAYENALAAQCIKTAAALPSVKKLTLLIGSILRPLPEGTMIFEQDLLIHD